MIIGRLGLVATMCMLPYCALKVQAAETPPAAPSRQTDQPGETNPADKSGFTLFNPTPRSMMRDFETDRPDQVQGPFTIDAGHFQVELDLVNYSLDRSLVGGQSGEVQQLLIAPTNVRIGLLNDLEIDVVATPFIWREDKSTFIDHARIGRTQLDREGPGDTVLRMKLNLMGNDAGSVAFGLVPFIKFPTNQSHLGNHAVEGGFIFPLAIKLPNTFELGMQTEVDVLHNAAGGSYHADWVNAIVLHRDIIPEILNGYIEYYLSVSGDRHVGPYETADFGFLLAVTKDIQLDCGMNCGVSRRAPDLNPFVGLSVRF